MKQSHFYVCLVLATLCFASCVKSEVTDRRLFDLKGNVRSVDVFENVRAHYGGDIVWDNYQRSYYFNKKGEIYSYQDKDLGEVTVERKRDKQGNIISIKIPFLEENLFATLDYKWNAQRYPISKVISVTDGDDTDQYSYRFRYNDANVIVGMIEKHGGEEWETNYKYEVLSNDAIGNWTKRKVYHDNSCAIEERVIRYYATNSGSASSETSFKDEYEWLYGTWQCSTDPACKGVIEISIQEDGKIWNNLDNRWYTYTILHDELGIIGVKTGRISIGKLILDKANKRFNRQGRDNQGWFQKVK